MFDAGKQQDVSEIKCKSLNADQEYAFGGIMKVVHDEVHPQQMFFLNAPGGYGKTPL